MFFEKENAFNASKRTFVQIKYSEIFSLWILKTVEVRKDCKPFKLKLFMMKNFLGNCNCLFKLQCYET